MTNVEIPKFYKQSAESYAIGFEFAGRLPTGALPDSATVAAIVVDTGASASATVLDSTTATIDGTQVTAGVKAGTSGITYKITFTVTLDNASADVLEEDIYMIVEDL